MSEILMGIAAVVATFGGGYLMATARSRRHAAWRKLPFSAEWEAILERNVKHYNLLPPALRRELKGHVQIILAEKSFEGCGGLEITDEMRVTVAGLAALLLLNRRTSLYRDLKTILMYPKAYLVGSVADASGAVSNEQQGRLGESWDNGSVVLSWNDVTNTANNIKDGHNLVLHEFAHQLDQEDGRGDGVPILEQESQYVTWAEVLSPEYEKLKKRSSKGKRSVLREYGATNAAEFFAVATESFFEKPRQLKEKHPDLYDELADYYQLDPVSWSESEVAAG